MRINTYAEVSRLLADGNNFFNIRPSRSGRKFVLCIFYHNNNLFNLPSTRYGDINVYHLGNFSFISIEDTYFGWEIESEGEYVCTLQNTLAESIEQMDSLLRRNNIHNYNYCVQDELIDDYDNEEFIN